VILKAIAGLGNPGERYRRTRHNAGFWLVDALAREGGISWKKRFRFAAWTGEGTWRGHRLILIKPAGFMNNSGPPLRTVIDYFKVPPTELLVAVDDVNLPAGRLRIRAGGGAGGHHGLESVIGTLGTREFPRLRIGIGGGARNDLTGHVLGEAGDEEIAVYRRAIERAVEAVGVVLEYGLEKAMSEYNPGPENGPGEEKGGAS